ncbi:MULTISPECIES: transcriptional regulator [Pandoraea]|uniref:transcriptional regulator n=1 Tax=Pandoraea TaxID=93217 RepID=UPI001F5DD269|nr:MULTISPECIES: transcriptional regulator [Pandoraea]MCI3206532.1 transcriptional regulator [Pandoraea sp. LA3]MDN4584560.1 transcriptional regulator [Pandoraea capi]
MYHYTETGLQNVWLANGYTVRKTPYGETVSIDDADGLSLAIGRAIAKKPHLTGCEFRFLRKALGLSQNRAGDLLGAAVETVSLWERRGRIPKGADHMLRAIYLETVDGNVKLKELIEQLIDLDRKNDEEKLVFQDTADGWFPKAA